MNISPILQTERLYLREMRIEDARDFWLLNRDIDVIRHTGDPPFSGIADARRFIQAYDHYGRFGYGRWNVYVRNTDEYLGFAGLKYWPKLEIVDLGYRIKRTRWGMGYATEAAQKCLEYGFDTLKLEEISAWSKAENHASIRVLRKLGFSTMGEEKREDGLWQRFQISRED